MPGLLKKISDYDRLAEELEEAKARLAKSEGDLKEARSEIEKLRSQLESAREKAREERRRRSEEEARRGRAEKKLREKLNEISDLQHRIDSLEAEASRPEAIAVLERESEISCEKVIDYVNGLGFQPGEKCLSATVPPELSEGFLREVPGMLPWASRVIRGGKGLACFVSGRKACFLEPPLPVEQEARSSGGTFDFAILEPLLEKRLVGFVSIHRDLYAVLVLDGEVRERVFEEKDVLGKSKKGGFSQARFARSREDQVKHLLAEAGEAVKRVFSGRNPPYVLVEGDDRTVSAFLEMGGQLGGHRVVRYALPSKLTKRDVDALPEKVWMWKAWSFDLPSRWDQPRG